MDLDDLEPRKKPVEQRNLDVLSIDELEAYIADLQAEIERVRAKIAAKRAHLAGAAGLFKADFYPDFAESRPSPVRRHSRGGQPEIRRRTKSA